MQKTPSLKYKDRNVLLNLGKAILPSKLGDYNNETITETLRETIIKRGNNNHDWVVRWHKVSIPENVSRGNIQTDFSNTDEIKCLMKSSRVYYDRSFS